MTQGRMTYDLRRLRLHGLIERIPATHRYQVTDLGFRTACLVTRAYTRVLRPALAEALAADPPMSGRLRTCFDRLDAAIGQLIEEAHLAA
jgi:predicted MarR family transcription regulator